MYLKSLEMQGFKSFPDKIKLNFDKGLTAVVGPNGSGKSNIGDAVRWVLGEQSTKTLRGNKMEDVIFSGTALRKPVGFASVTLNIDNKSHKLAIESDEVSITRKLFRSGESEYHINGKSVRLKDINELFMDTGLGRDGYSIIGQGRIAEIVGAKSNERRDIFEEASGISKFRYRKTEAERKLSLAQDNILRLRDIVSELEGRIEPLKIQSQKAEKFVELAKQRKELEISIWVNQLCDIKSQINDVAEKKLICTANYEKIEREIKNQEDIINKKYTAMQQTSVKCDELQDKILETEKTSSTYKSDIAVCKNDIIHSEETIKSLGQQKQLEENTSLELDKKIENTKKHLENISSQKLEVDCEITQLTQTLENLQHKVDDISKNFDKTGETINKLYTQQSNYNSEIMSTNATLTEISNQLKNNKLNLTEYEQAHKNYENQTLTLNIQIEEALLKERQYNIKITENSEQYKSIFQTLNQKKQEFEKVNLDLKEKQQRIRFLSDLENNMEGFTHSVKEIIKASKFGKINGIHGTVAELINVKSIYTTAIETALGGALQNIIVNSEENAKQCIEYLKNSKAGRATFLPITAIKGNSFTYNGVQNQQGVLGIAENLVTFDAKYSGIISSLLGRIVICENIDCATLIAKQYAYRFKILTLDGQIINAGGSFTGGSINRSGGVLKRKNEIEILNKNLTLLQNSYNQLQQDINALQQNYNIIAQNLENDRTELSTLVSNKIRLQSEYSSKMTLFEQIQSQLTNNNIQCEQLEKRIIQLKEKIVNSAKSLEIVNQQIKSLETNIADEKDKCNKLKQQSLEESEKLSKKRLKQLEIAKDIESAEREIKSLLETEKSLSDKNEYYLLEILKHNRIITEKNSFISEYTKLIENTEQNVIKYRSEIKEWQEKHNTYEDKINQLRTNLKGINNDKEQISKEMTRFEERKITLQKKIDDIILQMWEIYELTPTEAEHTAKEVKNILKVQSDLNEVRNKIKQLGNVNVSAIEEYKEVAERYKFLSEQLKDVEISKRELEKLISSLTMDMQKIFSESFAQINENFKKIFVELFGGGKAELVLTEPENILESGIEIIVAPPGKVIKNLISLSGGEQAFIAIAIYFAILKINPSPFCILDEIDAALDEVNVRKYSQYLKKFTHSTQFIMVTHRRGSMETANVLYGVTMQEDGISKLLRMEQVDFNDEIMQ